MGLTQGLINQVKRLKLYPKGYGKAQKALKQGSDMIRVLGFVHVYFQSTLAAKLEDVLEGAQTWEELSIQWTQRSLGERVLRMVCWGWGRRAVSGKVQASGLGAG